MYTFDPDHPYTIVQPLNGESIASFLYRFRRAKGNRISSASAFGKLIGIGFATCRWEKLRFHPRPTQAELEALSQATRIEVDRLNELFPLPGEALPPEQVRFCAACYLEEPCHRLAWHLKATDSCDRHPLRLLPACPGCKKPFEVADALAAAGCQPCGMSFKSMKKRQRAC
ncbi:TniQ family protein [Microcoleus sp. FACHB-1515]|uniref:TniQ family protein n=1 Tax=Microcoleus sp. FACHB-1515 TaxID=2692821 RepID=UPI0016841B81|nr:TniQ family protein [Microcoleus sp. FACHB-1515]